MYLLPNHPLNTCLCHFISFYLRTSGSSLPCAKDLNVVGGPVPDAGDEDQDDVDARPLIRHEQEGSGQHCRLWDKNQLPSG